MKLKWWEDSVDEMFIGFCIAVIACFCVWKGGVSGTTVAGTAVGGLAVYMGVKPRKKNGGQDDSKEI